VHSFPRGVLWRWPWWYSAMRYVALLARWLRELYCQTTYSVRHRTFCIKVSIFYNTTKWCTNLDIILLWKRKKKSVRTVPPLSWNLRFCGGVTLDRSHLRCDPVDYYKLTHVSSEQMWQAPANNLWSQFHATCNFCFWKNIIKKKREREINIYSHIPCETK